jgi:hypothetical protein
MSSVTVAFLLAFSPLLIVLGPASAASAALRQGVLDQCDNGATSTSTLFSRAGNRTDCTLAFDNHATVDNGYVDLTVQGTRSSGRPNPFDRTPDAFPVTPWLDVSANGSREWAFDSGRFGPLGHTTLFDDGLAAHSVDLNNGSVFPLAFDVPSSATIINATITLSGDPTPYWAEQYPLTDNNVSPGEEGPFLVAFNGLLFAAWSTMDTRLTGGSGSDFDVVVRSYNGTEWGAVTDISPPASSDGVDDREVVMLVYRSELWVIWSHGDDNGVQGITDLMYSRYNGASWSAPAIISPTPTDGINTYENAVVFAGRLWVLWKTSDSTISAGTPGPNKDLDIVVRSYDGATDSWDTTTEMTAPDNNYLDWISDIEAFNGKLYVVWEASYWDLTKTYGFDAPLGDIHMRVYDGQAWGAIQNMSHDMDVTEGRTNEDQAPHLSIFRNPVSGLDELYLIWMRGCLQETQQGVPLCPTDYDIAYRMFNGAAWTPGDYLTYASDTDEDMFPCTADFNQVFYVFWVSGVITTEDHSGPVTLISTYGDIQYRAYNGREWSDIKEVTHVGTLDNVSHPACAVYANRLFVAWESPTDGPASTTQWDITVRNIDFNKVQITGVYGGLVENYTSPVNLSFSDTVFPFNLTALNSLLGNEPVAQDEWGNQISRIPLNLSTQFPASVQVTGIDIRYEYHVRVNITQALNDQITAQKGDLYTVSTVYVPLQVGMEDGAGRIRIDQIHVDYRIDYPPELLRSIASIKIDEDSGLALPFDLNDYFTDDWDAGHLRFEMANATNTQHVLVALSGSMLTVGTLTPNWCGVATFQVFAFDRNAYVARSNNVTVFVTCVNDPPQLQPIDDINLSATQVYAGDLSAFDPDEGDVLRFSTDSTWVTVDPVTGSFLIGNKTGMPERFVFNMTVSDLAGASDTKSATLFRAPPLNHALESNPDFPYYLFLLFLGPIVGYIAYRVRAQRMQAEEEARDDRQRQQDLEDLKEIDG